MSQPTDTTTPTPAPSGGGTGARPHVHHAGPQGQPGVLPVTGADDSEQIDPEDYENPGITNYLLTVLPPNLCFEGEVPVPASTEPSPGPAPSVSSDQAARDASDGIYQGLTKKPASFWSNFRRAGYLGLLMDEVDIRAVKQPLVYNSPKVPDGGVAVIKAVQQDTRAKLMQVPVEDLGRELARLQRIRRAKEEVGAISSVLDANETVVLARISGMVNKGLGIGESLILSDGVLARVMGPAIAIRSEPASAAVATRAENARNDKAIRADEQSRQAAGAPEAARPSTTVSTTVVAPDQGKAAPTPPAPALQKKK